MYQDDELKHYGIPGMKWGVHKDRIKSAASKIGRKAAEIVGKYGKETARKMYEGVKEVGKAAGPMLKKGAQAAQRVVSKMRDTLVKNVKAKVQNGRRATQSKNFDELFKQEMANVRKWQQNIETAARKGASAQEQATMGAERDAAMRRAKEYKAKRGK